MAWTTRALIGLTVGIGCVLGAAACDDSGSTTSSDSSGTTAGQTSGGTTGGGMVMGDPIPFMGGWAALEGNSYGIQGAFYVYSDMPDGGTSTIMPAGGAANFEMSGAEVCASGTAGQVMNGAGDEPDYSTYWGAGIGFNLSQEVGVDTALPYNASMNGVTGFSFNVGGSNPIPDGGAIRFSIKVNGEPTNSYCVAITQPGANTFMLSDLHQSCWMNDTTLPTPDPSKLEALQWQYVTNVMAPYDFDICISQLAVIPG